MRWPLLLLSALCLLPAADDGGRQLNTQTSWFGNSFPGGKGDAARWMMLGVDDLAVAGDRIYCLIDWDERGGETNIYSTDGEHVKKPEGWHAWGWQGGTAVAVDDAYVYYAMGHNQHDGGGKNFAGIARYTRTGQAAPFPGGESGHRLLVNGDHDRKPTGVAVHGGELFVADPVSGAIIVYATADLKEVRRFPCPGAGRLAVDATPEHALWTIVGTSVRRIGRDGKDLGVAISDCLKPVALAIAPEGDLLVADSDPGRQRIQRYRAGTWKRDAAADFGSPIYQGAKPGVVQPGRFFRITGVACGGDGSLYVAAWDFGGKLWKFDAQRRLVWVREGTEFVNCADADPGDDTSLYSTGHRYVVDYAKPPGQNWRDAAITVDPLKYPDDPRLKVDRGMAMKMLRIGGRKLMTGKFQMDSMVCFWRFDGEIAVPAAVFCGEGRRTQDAWPADRPDGAWLWTDRNGDGRMQAEEYQACPRGSQAVSIDERGDIVVNTGGWEAGKGRILVVPLTGLDAQGVPQWDFAAAIAQPVPSEGGLRQLSKLAYDPASDRMYLGTWTAEHPHPGGGWEQMDTGAVLMRFDDWSKRPKLAWSTCVIPPEGLISKVPKAWSLEREHIFIAYSWQQEREAVDVYQLSDGKRVGRLLPTAEVGETTGWIDMNDAVQSHRRADGTYVICAEEVWMAKGLFWLWKP